MSSTPSKIVIFLSVPGLRHQDLAHMPNLNKLVDGGTSTRINHAFPAVTWPSQANLLTGKPPAEHGVVANGFYWRENHKVEMWTAWNEVIQQPQIWDVLKTIDSNLTSAAWFPMLSKGCDADYVCMPAPIHQPDGSEDPWCYTKPQEYYGTLLESLGHFPLQHFWGPMANIKSTSWIANSAAAAAAKFKPNFFYIYLPHLDYQAQKFGPNSEQATQSVKELDQLIGQFSADMQNAYATDICWMIASEYVITEVDHVLYPNRILRDANLLGLVHEDGGGELIDFENTPAWALVDHQFSHIFVNQSHHDSVEKIADLFRDREGVDQILVGDARKLHGMDHERSGEIVVISKPNSWQAYYWWQDDKLAPSFARTVDIHKKPGYDPVELHFDMATKSIPLDAGLIKGSHGAPSKSAEQMGVFLSNEASLVNTESINDFALFDVVLNQFK